MQIAQPLIPAPEGSILEVTARALNQGQLATFPLRSQIRLGSAMVIPVAVDNGNDAFKGATLSPTAGDTNRSVLTTTRTPTAFVSAEEIQGKQETTYCCDGVSFWTGETALAHGGDSLRIGPTNQRLSDQRQIWFLAPVSSSCCARPATRRGSTPLRSPWLFPTLSSRSCPTRKRERSG